ncbi:hypothetical protein PN465_14495 [Nodularia spumigena CS-584]|jgi:hypothetical protein|uniref:Uncharacterized protein n=1 Tax=Nodularia spumigena UHCC 0060 TaxID=3110300 RepID=A0ABU5UN23_NODSP|nr:hypothetical protein [Nodularia spumigena]AHJ30431.1 hypothetical protein NSP_41310 [Nodularia spumigena CCY9414]EAW46957.1 hypothetical protein N9414_14795 [Nodularia spumigena CCY9414]MDB9383419.1 hypothetical protein [Nodularia spumigena CS-584]MEA5524370.1 hypothetical protein [Nodularia spumigena UHCC 0143]MEA5558730.1 hypothetical protein [Nodularia spumigena CH309]
MKVKLLNVLTVCFVTLVVLSPGLVVFSIVWGRHIEFVKMQNLSCEIHKNLPENSALFSQTSGTSLSQYETNNEISDRNLVNRLLIAAEQYRLASILQWFVLITPIFVGLGIIVYDRYLVYRAAILREKVEMLERLWQQSIE